MKKYNKTFSVLSVMAIISFIIVGCKKEDAKELQNATLSDTTITLDSLQDNYNGDNIYKGTNDRGIYKPLKPVADYPMCIKVLFSDPEYDFWDFSKIERPHDFDTAGYHTFLIPPKDEFMAGFNGLIITTERDPISNQEEISQRYVMSFPLDCWNGFDPMWYYDRNESAYVEFLSYDFTEMFYCGYWDVRNDRIDFLRKGTGSGYWDYKQGGFNVTVQVPLWELVHREDFNDCEYGLLVAEGILDVLGSICGAGVGASILFCTFNSFAFNWMRKNAC